jgi:hypothetical protein
LQRKSHIKADLKQNVVSTATSGISSHSSTTSKQVIKEKEMAQKKAEEDEKIQNDRKELRRYKKKYTSSLIYNT